MYINVLNIYNDKTNAVTSLHGSVAAFLLYKHDGNITKFTFFNKIHTISNLSGIFGASFLNGMTLKYKNQPKQKNEKDICRYNHFFMRILRSFTGARFYRDGS